MTTDQWIAAIAAAGGIGVLAVSMVAVVTGLKEVGDQLKTSVFIAYTDRYSKIMSQLPFDARRPGSGYRLDDVSPAEQATVLSAFREYFNLCSEEQWLRQMGRIDRATWDAWKLGMQDTIHFPCFREAWQILAREYAVYEFFAEFMTQLIEETADAAAAGIPDPGELPQAQGE